jgi:hypothetical protein
MHIGLTATQEKEASALFWLKYDNLCRVVNYHADRHGVTPDERDEWIQDSLTELWRSCCSLASRSAAASRSIDCQRVARAGWRSGLLSREHRRRVSAGVKVKSLTAMVDRSGFDAPEKCKDIMVDGVQLTVTDAMLDCPERVAQLNGPTVDLKTVARRLGVSRQAVAMRAAQLGGTKLGSRWHFPADAGQQAPGRNPPCPGTSATAGGP